LKKKAVNPQMLILARQFRNMTQREVAAAIEVNQAKISKAELGIIGVREGDEFLGKLSALYEFPEDFFFQDGQIYSADVKITDPKRRF